MQGDDQRDAGSDGWRERREGPSGKLIALVLVLVLLAIFVLQNTTQAQIDVLFWHLDLPLWILIGASAVLGFVAGWAIARLRRRGRD